MHSASPPRRRSPRRAAHSRLWRKRETRGTSMNRFIQAFANLFRIEDLRNRLFFTLGLLAVYPLGAHTSTPRVHKAVFTELIKQASGPMPAIFALFFGGNARRMAIFPLCTMPHITSALIPPLL